MSLRKKIFFSFFISAFIIAVLVVFEYVNFIQVKDEMRSLEVADTIRSKSLQLRRHEKNFLLYASDDELDAIYDYLGQLENITATPDVVEKSPRLRGIVAEYKERFGRILSLLAETREEFTKAKPSFTPYERFAGLVEADFLDKPGYAAYTLVKVFGLPESHPLVLRLKELNSEIATLRENGEDIIAASKIFDLAARSKAERGIHISQVAIIAGFPLFLGIGLGTLFYISNDLVRRLYTLTKAVEKTGSKYITVVPVPESVLEHKDEVDVLIDKFGRMGKQLELWEEELHEKNSELLESKKLAAIGTLASGVAHELNNPLNNIFLSVQVLKRKLGEEWPISVRNILDDIFGQTVDDIFGQTVRVKGIVGDLLEFAREREPHFEEVEMTALIRRAYDLVCKSTNTKGIEFVLDAPPSVILRADPGLMERVFVNLFSNAIAAIGDAGEIVAKVEDGDAEVKIWVSDNGEGMSEEDKDKVFDPFFTKKDKGTGLGLAIVLNIIKKHHGTISVESYKGEGTVFEITLPKG